MKLKPNEYAIAQKIAEKGRRFYLVKILKEVKEGYLSVYQKDCHFKPVRSVIPAEAFVLNLGLNPHPGTVYGHDLKALYQNTVSSVGGKDVHFFASTSEETQNRTLKALDRAAKKLKAAGLGFLAEQDIIYEIRPEHGKWGGCFISPGKKEDSLAKIVLFLNQDNELSDYSDYIYLHEFGHALHHFYLKQSKTLEARWLKLYMESVAPTVCEAKKVTGLYKSFRAATTTADWRRSLEDDEDKAQANLILRHIKASHRLGAKDLDLLLASEDYDSLQEIWPDCDIYSSDLKPIISEYATKNYSETIAEAFAFHLTGKKLPKLVERLLGDSIRFAWGAR